MVRGDRRDRRQISALTVSRPSAHPSILLIEGYAPKRCCDRVPMRSPAFNCESGCTQRQEPSDSARRRAVDALDGVIGPSRSAVTDHPKQPSGPGTCDRRTLRRRDRRSRIWIGGGNPTATWPAATRAPLATEALRGEGGTLIKRAARTLHAGAAIRLSRTAPSDIRGARAVFA